MTLNAVLFDLDNTLYDTSTLVKTARMEACEAMLAAGLPAKSAEEAFAKLKKIVKKHGSNYPRHYNKLCESYGITENIEIVTSGRIAYHNAKFALMNPFPNTERVLLHLAKCGVKLGIVTNGLEDKQWEKILRLKIRHFFDTIIISGEQDPQADKKRLIRRALRELGTEADSTAFIGDNLKTDIAPANALGLLSVRFVPSSKKLTKPRKRLERPEKTIRRIEDLPAALGF